MAIPFTNNFFNTTGANAGLYQTDAAPVVVVESGKNCCPKLVLPCGFTKNLGLISVDATDSPCMIKWCEIKSIFQSLAATNLLEANQSGALTTPLTTAQETCIANLATMLSDCFDAVAPETEPVV